MVPKDWRSGYVGDVCVLQNGTGFGPSDWGKIGLPIIRIQNLNGGAKFDYYAGAVDPKWLVEPGQLLFAWAGTRGVSFGPTVWRGPRGVLNQHIYKVQPRAKVDGQWLYWVLRNLTDQIEDKAHGFKSTLVHVRKTEIEQQRVLIPPIEEQRKIGQALQIWDQAIDTMEKLSENASLAKCALLELLLAKTKRFEGFDEEWNEYDFSALAGLSSRKFNPKVAKQQKWCLELEHLLPNSGSISTGCWTDEQSSTKNEFSPGDVLFGKLRPYLRKFWLADIPGVCSTEIWVLKVDRTICEPSYLFYLVQSQKFMNVAGVSTGSRMPRADWSVVRNTKFSIPGLAEQKAIARCLSSLDALRENTLLQVDNLKNQRLSLTRDLLSGRRRLQAAATVCCGDEA